MPEMAKPRAKWTVLAYIAAHNNLDELGKRSLGQILDIGSTPQLNLAVLYDGPASATRYIGGSPGVPDVEEPLGDFDSGDPRQLLESVRWAYERCPAERYGLVLWSHGTGWRPDEIDEVGRQARGDAAIAATETTERAEAPGSLVLFRSTLAQLVKPESRAERAILFDDGTGHSLDTLELGRVAGEAARLLGQPLDFLGMDACLMATLEVAYQLRNSVRYLVASEELVPGFSWPYDQILGELRGRPEQSAPDLATSVVRHYTHYYSTNPPPAGDVTQVALDLSNVGIGAETVDELSAALLADMESHADALWQAQFACYERESRQRKREPNKFRFHLWDIGSLAAHLARTLSGDAVGKSAQAVVDALRSGGAVVLAEGHYGAWFDGTSGVSVYLSPPKGQRISPYYEDLDLTKNTRWGQMIAAYHTALA